MEPELLSGGLVLRSARDDDANGVIALIGAVFEEYPDCVLDVDAEEPELRAPASSFDAFWVVERAAPEAEVVGCVGLGHDSGHDSGRDSGNERTTPVAELKKLYLLPSVRGLGLARRLVAVVEAAALERGARRIELWTDTRFVDAHGLYEHLGYRRTGRERDLHDLARTRELHFVKLLAGGASDP